MARTVDDYDSMAKREMIKAKQEKAMMYVVILTCTLVADHMPCLATVSVHLCPYSRRVQKFRADYADLRGQFEKLKSDVSMHAICYAMGDLFLFPPIIERGRFSLGTLCLIDICHTCNTHGR